MRRGTLGFLVGALMLVALVGLSIVSMAPPAARGEEAPATEFSAGRAMVHVDAIAEVPHPVGTHAHEEARAYVFKAFESLGLEVRVQRTSVAVKAAGVTHGAEVKNVIARLPGTGGGPAVLLVAHYDSVPQSRGASDDASGVATLLETARALKAGPAFPRDVLFLVSDAEELSMCGAMAFTLDELHEHPVGVALNFEARGTGGPVALYETSDDNGSLIAAVADAAPRVVSSSLLGALARALPNDSDATVLKRARVPTLAFAYVDRLFQYHQSTDTTEALDLRSLQHDGEYALPLVRRLASGPLPLPASGQVVYFDLFGRTVVSYSALLARVLALGTLALFYVVVGRARRDPAVTPRAIVRGALACVGAVFAGLVAAGAVHALLAFVIDPFVLLARPGFLTIATLGVGATTFIAALSPAVRPDRLVATAMGGQLLWAIALVVAAVVAPGASFAVEWPLVFALAGTSGWLTWRSGRSDRADASAFAGLVPLTYFTATVAYTLYLTVGGEAPETVLLVAVSAKLLALPLFGSLPAWGVRRVAVAGGALALATLAFGLLVIGPARGLPRPDRLVYLEEPAKKIARWTTDQAKHDTYVGQRIPAGRVANSAVFVDFPPLETTAHSDDDGVARHTQLRIASSRHVRCFRLYEVTKEPITRVRVNDRPVAEVVRFSAELDEKLLRWTTGGGEQSAWVMEYCGADEKGFDVSLDSPTGKPVRLRILQISDGLPGAKLRERVKTESYPDAESDTTQVMVDVTL